MTSVKVGRANEAFEASEEDDDVDTRYGKFHRCGSFFSVGGQKDPLKCIIFLQGVK